MCDISIHSQHLPYCWRSNRMHSCKMFLQKFGTLPSLSVCVPNVLVIGWILKCLLSLARLSSHSFNALLLTEKPLPPWSPILLLLVHLRLQLLDRKWKGNKLMLHKYLNLLKRTHYFLYIDFRKGETASVAL